MPLLKLFQSYLGDDPHIYLCPCLNQYLAILKFEELQPRSRFPGYLARVRG